MAFFGLETRGDDTRLHSFSTHGNAALAKAVRALHANHSLTHPILNVSDVSLDAVIVDYVYGYNKTAGQKVFFGQGGGDMPPAAGGGPIPPAAGGGSMPPTGASIPPNGSCSN